MVETPTPDVIDWEALYKQVSEEAEQLRLAVLKLRYQPTWADRLPVDAMQNFLSDPVKVYVAAMIAIVVVLPLARGLVGLLRRHYER